MRRQRIASEDYILISYFAESHSERIKAMSVLRVMKGVVSSLDKTEH